MEKYIESLKPEETKELIKEVLNKNKETTYNKYLKPLYEKTKDRIQAVIDGINRRIANIVDNSFSSRWDDYSVSLAEESDRSFLRNENDPRVKDYLNKILHDTRLYCFEDKLFLCELLKEKYSEAEIKVVTGELRSYLEDLKHTGVRSLPKSNVLIAIYELESKFNINTLLDDFIKNLRYEEYAGYVIKNYKDIDSLYEGIKKRKDDHRIRNDISSIYKKIYKRTGNKEAKKLSHYYGFVHNGNLVDLDELVESDDFYEKYYQRILKEGNAYNKIQLYAKLEMKKELYEFLILRKDYSGLSFYASFLDEHYHKELLKLFKDKTIEKLKSANNRTEYAEAAVFVRAIKDLSDEKKLTEDFIDELKIDERFKRRPALFYEIKKCLKT